ncbi:hypothetical protein FGO68_gene10476 [Halteria grandinella]|uniref:Uncharacterized protein n=1 Tax=Halteria grandinella TaxID=5974 RepID=A0A8J8NPY7_HALGN|nr:hypothetical protein FGO68_gene10476 [Halteria grandinella]
MQGNFQYSTYNQGKASNQKEHQSMLELEYEGEARFNKIKKTKAIHKSNTKASCVRLPHKSTSANTSKGKCNKHSGTSSKCSSSLCSKDGGQALQDVVPQSDFLYVTPDKKYSKPAGRQQGLQCSQHKGSMAKKYSKHHKLRGEQHSSLNKTVCTPGHLAGSSAGHDIAASVLRTTATPLFSNFKDFQNDQSRRLNFDREDEDEAVDVSMTDVQERTSVSPKVRPFNPYHDVAPYHPSEQVLHFQALIGAVKIPLNDSEVAHSGSVSTPCHDCDLSLDEAQSSSDSLDEVIQHWNLLQISPGLLNLNRRDATFSGGECILNPEAYDDSPAMQPALQLSPDDFLSDLDIARQVHLDRLREGSEASDQDCDDVTLAQLHPTDGGQAPQDCECTSNYSLSDCGCHCQLGGTPGLGAAKFGGHFSIFPTSGVLMMMSAAGNKPSQL